FVMCVFFYLFSTSAALSAFYCLALHDALPIFDDLGEKGRDDPDRAAPFPLRGHFLYGETNVVVLRPVNRPLGGIRPGRSLDPLEDRKSTRLNSSHVKNSYAVFCLKEKSIQIRH